MASVGTIRFVAKGYEFGVAIEGWPTDVIAQNIASTIESYVKTLTATNTKLLHMALSSPRAEAKYRAIPEIAPLHMQTVMVLEVSTADDAMAGGAATRGRVHVFAS